MLLQAVANVTSLWVFPLAFAFWLWKARDRSKSDWAVRLLLVGALYCLLFLIGSWDSVGYYFRYVLLAPFASAVFLTAWCVNLLPLFNSGGIAG